MDGWMAEDVRFYFEVKQKAAKWNGLTGQSTSRGFCGVWTCVSERDLTWFNLIWFDLIVAAAYQLFGVRTLRCTVVAVRNAPGHALSPRRTAPQAQYRFALAQGPSVQRTYRLPIQLELCPKRAEQ